MKTGKTEELLSGINWRQILVHCFAAMFLLLSFRQFSVLNNLEYARLILLHGGTASNYLTNGNEVEAIISSYYFWLSLSGLIALFIAFSVSLLITIKKKWFWLNSLIVLIITILLNRQRVFDWEIIFRGFYVLGNVFKTNGIEYTSIINGITLLCLSLFTFFNKKITSFIEIHNQPKKNEPSPEKV